MKRQFTFRNQIVDVSFADEKPEEPAELCVYDAIGKDPWTGGGISAADFRNMLKEVCPNRDRALDIKVSSKGGDVHEGMTIRNDLAAWPKPITGTITGIAASTASWFLPKNAKLRAFKNSQVFMHDAIAVGIGTAKDLRTTADELDKTSDQIAGIYAERSGRRTTTMRAMMQFNNRGTLLTGEEALEEGLVDEVVEGSAIHNFAPGELATMQNQLQAIYNSVRQGGAGQQPTTNNTMDKKKLIALLNKHGVTAINGVDVSEQTPIEHLEAALEQVLEAKNKTAATAPRNQDFEQLRDDIKELKEANKRLLELNNKAEKDRITNEIGVLVANDQVTEPEREKAIARALKDPTYLDELKARPAKAPGAPPLPAGPVEELAGDFKTVQNYVLDNGPRFREQFIGKNAGRSVDLSVCNEISTRAAAAANAIAKHRGKILEAWNSNSIDSGLQRQVILQDMLEAYAVVFARLDIFSTIYNTVPLQGTDKIDVPYFPLHSTAAVQFVSGTGYTTARDWTQQKKEITVGGDGDAATCGDNATAGTVKDRLYMMINFRSYDLRRQPYLNLVKLFQQAANKFGVDVVSAVVKRVIIAASFTSVAKTVAAAAFVGDDVADLRAAATTAYWPEMGRSLVLDDTYYTSLLKDTDFKHQYSYGTTDPLHSGRIPSAYGFENIIDWANLTNYVEVGQNMTGWINHKSAVLIATSPIMPTEEVRLLLSRYDVVVDPKTGCAFEYRRFGDATKDITNELIEVSIGAAPGVTTALQRIRSAAP